jgi:hypothetical protein
VELMVRSLGEIEMTTLPVNCRKCGVAFNTEVTPEAAQLFADSIRKLAICEKCAPTMRIIPGSKAVVKKTAAPARMPYPD